MVTRRRLVTCAAALAGALLSSANASAAIYGGQNDQHAPITLTVAKAGQVKAIAVAWGARCDEGKIYTFGGILTAAKKRPAVLRPGDNPMVGKVTKGRFSAKAYGAENLGDQMGTSITQTIRGRIKARSASGTWSVHVDILDPEGNRVGKCDTGTMHWSAGHGPTIYGGSTTQGEPVVAITRQDRRKVAYFGFGWHSVCQPQGFWEIAEEFGNFPLTSGGTFGDAFTNDYPFDDGSGKNAFSYDIAGSLKKGRGSGTLSVKVVQSDSAGATKQTCDTGTVHWSVTQ